MILGCVLVLTVALLIMWRWAERDAANARRHLAALADRTARQRTRIRHQRWQICKYLDELDAACGEPVSRPVDVPLDPPVIPGPAFTTADLAVALAALEELPLTSPEDTR